LYVPYIAGLGVAIGTICWGYGCTSNDFSR